MSHLFLHWVTVFLACHRRVTRVTLALHCRLVTPTPSGVPNKMKPKRIHITTQRTTLRKLRCAQLVAALCCCALLLHCVAALCCCIVLLHCVAALCCCTVLSAILHVKARRNVQHVRNTGQFAVARGNAVWSFR